MNSLLGTGEGAIYSDGRLNELLTKTGSETILYRSMSYAEYDSYVNNIVRGFRSV